MDAGLDTDDMIIMECVSIGLTDTTSTLHDTLVILSRRMVVEVFARLAQYGKPRATPQPAEGITHAERIAKDEAAPNWLRHAAVLPCQVHAFSPFSGASATLGDVAIKFWQAEASTDHPAETEPDTVLAANAKGVIIAYSVSAPCAT